jgi:hypothetical protein
VEVQNEGNKITDDVSVEDMLDVFLKTQKPVPESTPDMDASRVHPSDVDPGTRNCKFTFDHVALHGTGEPGYGVKFFEKDTKFKFRFWCELNTLVKNISDMQCGVIFNQARVKFNCNPLFNTNLAQGQIHCMADTVSTCPVQSDTVFLSVLPQTNTPLMGPSFLTDPKYQYLNQSGIITKWYPSKGLSSAFEKNPTWTTGAQREYTLVAYKPCEFTRVIHVFLPPCSLKIELLSLDLSNDQDNPLHPKNPKPGKKGTQGGVLIGQSGQSNNNQVGAMLDAKAIGYSLTNPQLLWNDCKNGTERLFQKSQNPQTYFFGVTDLLTGCTAELKTVK